MKLLKLKRAYGRIKIKEYKVKDKPGRKHLQTYNWYTRRISLRSSAQAELLVPRSRTAIRQRCAFSVAGLPARNGLPVARHLTPVAHSALFLSGLTTKLFDRGWAWSSPTLKGRYLQLL